MITQTINLNLIPGGVLPRINVSQYDKGSRTLNFNIYNGAVLFPIPSGSSITIQGTKPDHTAFQYSCEYEGSVVTADLEQQMSVLAGEVVCEIAINKNTNLIGTGNFILCVEPAAVADDTVISETELPLIEQAIEAAAEAETSATAAAESAEEAASWSAHPPYIGENGNWYVYDPETEKFVNTGDPSRGPQGIQGETGPKGDTGVTPDITMNASVDNTSGTPAVVVTETGTDEDPVFSLAFSGLKGPQGDTGEQGETGPQGPAGPTGNGISNITKTGTSGLVDTYTITYTDGTTSTFTVTNGRDGSGSGDMSESDYDPTGSVKNAGGIPDFVADQISGKQNVILSSALPIGGINRTTVEEALGALADETGGHTILNESGIELPQRSKLQFEGCEVTDDSTNDITKIKAEGGVTGVKGNAESDYRKGNVNLTPANIGAYSKSEVDTALNGKVGTSGASTNTTVAFTSNDLAANTTAKTSNTTNQPSTVAKLSSGETLASMFNKISSIFASVRKLWNTVGSTGLASGKTVTNLLGNTAIPSELGNTVTGALANIPFRFGIDANGNYGYIKAGADTVTPFSAITNVPLGTYRYNEYYSGNVTRTGNVSKTTYSHVYAWGFFNIQGKGITTLTIKGLAHNSYWNACGIKNNGEITSFDISGYSTSSKTVNVSDYRFIIVQSLVAQVDVTFG